MFFCEFQNRETGEVFGRVRHRIHAAAQTCVYRTLLALQESDIDARETAHIAAEGMGVWTDASPHGFSARIWSE